jgi:hypothetical protein
MPQFLNAYERVLTIAIPAGAAALALRMWHQDLAGRYRYFVVYLVYLLLSPCVLPFIDRQSDAYFLTFATLEVIAWVLQSLIVFELFTLLFKSYSGVAGAGRDFMKLALALAVLITILLAVVNHESGPGKYPVVETFFLVSRVVTSLILAFIVLMIGFMLWFPLPLNRNTLAYLGGYSLYFLGRGLTQFAGNMLGPNAYVWLSTISLTITCSCLMFWLARLTRSGEHLATSVGRRWNPEEEERLVRQLEGINASLARARK